MILSNCLKAILCINVEEMDVKCVANNIELVDVKGLHIFSSFQKDFSRFTAVACNLRAQGSNLPLTSYEKTFFAIF